MSWWLACVTNQEQSPRRSQRFFSSASSYACCRNDSASAISSSALQHAWVSSTAAGKSVGTSRRSSWMYWVTSSSLFVPMQSAISPGLSGPRREMPSKSISFSSSVHHTIPTHEGDTCSGSSPAGGPPVSPSSSSCSHPLAPFGLRLRDYQEECIQSVLNSLDQGHKRLGISLATGGGKTVIFTQLIDRVPPLSDTATQTLILAHRRELVEQAAKHCSHAYPDKTIELELGKLAASGTADITVASLQSITSRDRLSKFDPKRFKLVLVDEAHHIVAPGYLRVLRHLGLAIKQPTSPHLVGVSATFSRSDGLRLGAAIDEIVYHKDYVDMIGDKWLSDVIFTTVDTRADLTAVKKMGRGDFDIASLSRAVNTDDINDIAIRTWLAKAEGRKSTLVFCVDLAHVAALTQRFRHYGVDARYVTGDTPIRERSERLEAFKREEYPVLVNCGVFTEGTDIPNIDCILLARPTRSRNLLIQMIGRGMRLHPGKNDCHIIDMVSSLETGIITTPTLFGLDPSEIVSDAKVEDMDNLRDRREAERQRAESVGQSSAKPPSIGNNYHVTLTHYDSVFDLISDTSGEKHIHAISKYAWVQAGPDRYILSGPTGTYLRLERTHDESGNTVFEGWEVRALPVGMSKSPFAAPRKLLSALTLADAVHGCDNYAKDIFPYSFIWRRAPWRSLPPTDEQLKFLNRLRDEEDQLQKRDITKGKAADMITKLKHGARGRFASLEAEKRKRIRSSLSAEKEQARRTGDAIAVGPVLPRA
ncbi:P-loop containing nucleoside triphosphate hydrolase protein [Echria macrotheca]|uniref:P-loop containing nucleoside triphosphate hydrolase protein n=1 Tax=Echria macrotheca TaxID=438768 RepID=A0AAJ0F5H3_9PEZI|nr:P-loop containing nucleoside triphosphate hydrolase protein [Echria macrotheca]